MAAIIQQYRFVRLIMLLAIVALTIFLYALYYANPTIQTVPLSSLSLRLQNGDETEAIAAAAASSSADEDPTILDTQIIKEKLHLQDDSNATYAQQQYPEILLSAAASSVEPNNATILAAAAANKQQSAVVRSPPVTKNEQKVTTNSTNISSNATKAIQQHLDTTKGVRTGDLYAGGGHFETANFDLLCPDGGETLNLLILITSAPAHRDARLAIRQTWGHYSTRRDISIAFVLGETPQQPAVDDALAAENYMYGDMIRGHFVDSYNNLTLKTISALEWIDTYCSRVSFILKTDDDMFINVPRLLAFIEKHRKDTRVIFGRLAKKWKPIRNKKSKYYVSPQQYFPPVFPQFTTGPAYLMTADVVHALYTKALNQTYLKLEDVFTTGIVAQLVNVKRVHVNEFLNRRIAFNPCNIRKSISVHMVKSNEQFDLWKKLLDTNTKCK